MIVPGVFDHKGSGIVFHSDEQGFETIARFDVS